MNVRRIIAAAVIAGIVSAAMGDGMIVPTDPDIRVRGHWAVKYHRVNIKVRDQVASVHIDQEFVNTGRGMIEVEYLFPVPPEAAIDSMTMIVDGKEYAARMLDADEARGVYEEIVRKKKDPALLEYAGFGLYRTRAFPLEPGKPCKVVVTYKNICPRDNNLVEVWYPLNTEKFSAKPIEDLSVKVDIRNDHSDIAAVYSPTHDLDVDRRGANHVIATYSAKNVIPQTDFQVFYKAANEKVAATLLTRKTSGGGNGYFMLLVAPSPRKPSRKPMDKDVLVVLDRSGSMSGKKIEQAVESAKFIVNNLNPGDRFNVITYSDSVEKIFDSLVAAGGDNIKEARRRLDDVQATGGTDIHSALGEAMDVLDKKADGDADRPAYVIFLTDGKPTVGNTNEEDILSDTKRANRGARMFVFGVGYDVNVRLLDKLAIENKGRSDYVKPDEPIESKISALYRKIKNPVMTDLAVKVPGVRLFDVYPREVPDLFEGDQIVLFGRYDARDAERLPSDKVGMGAGQLVITGKYLGSMQTFECPVNLRTRTNRRANAFIERLWAMRRVGYLLDEIQLHGRSDEVIDEIIRLGMKYGIMTPYTSFLAEETTALHSEAELRLKAGKVAEDLKSTTTGAGGQMTASARQVLKEAKNAPAAPADAAPGVAVMQGNTNRRDYETDRTETVANVRQAGNQGVYRRKGNVWIASNATDVDPEKDRDKIQNIERFSKEYFELVRHNTVEENRILSLQQGNEELVIRLRGQVYNIK